MLNYYDKYDKNDKNDKLSIKILLFIFFVVRRPSVLSYLVILAY